MGLESKADLKTGTKSVLWGVHQFLWHPVTVGLAWHGLYGQWPRWHEWVAIFTHDLGYVGCQAMDDAEGQRHPIKGAVYAYRIVEQLGWIFKSLRHPIKVQHSSFRCGMWAEVEQLAEATRDLAIGHSRYFAKQYQVPLSKLFAADKASIYFDPAWFYLLRAKLSGELAEYMRNSKLPVGTTPQQWHSWYVAKVGSLI